MPAEEITDDTQQEASQSKRFVFVGEPWEQQPGESTPAYAAFVIYRDLGGKRSCTSVSRKLSKSRPLITRWSSRWQWVRRCEEFDREQDRLYQADLSEQRKAMAKRHASQAVALQTVAIKAMKAKYGEQFEKITAETLRDGDVLRFFIEASKLERTALGEPAEIVETQHTGGTPDNDRKPFIPLTHSQRIDDALALLEAARARAATGAAGAQD